MEMQRGKLRFVRYAVHIRRPLTFKILGYGFVSTYRKGEKGKYQLVAGVKRWKTLKAKLKEIARKTSPVSFDQRIQKLKEVQRGRINYFKSASISNKPNELDGWLRNRIRYCIWTDWKKPERKRKKPDKAWSRFRSCLPMEPEQDGWRGSLLDCAVVLFVLLTFNLLMNGISIIELFALMVITQLNL
jgi:hypothetical protein